MEDQLQQFMNPCRCFKEEFWSGVCQHCLSTKFWEGKHSYFFMHKYAPHTVRAIYVRLDIE